MRKTTTLLFFICICLPRHSFSANSKRQVQIDSLLNLLTKTADDTDKVNLLSMLGRKYGTSNSKEAISNEKKAIALGEKIKYVEGISTADYFLGNIYSNLSEPDSAIMCYSASLKIENERGDSGAISALLMNMGAAYGNQSNYPKSLECLFQALKIFEVSGNKRGQANCFNSIANVYIRLPNYTNTVAYYAKALALYQSLEDKPDIAMVEGNIGDTYAEQSDYPEASLYFTKALEAYISLGDSSGIERNQGNLGELYLKEFDFSKALQNIFSALKISRLIGFPQGEGHDLCLAGAVYLAIRCDTANNKTIPLSVSKTSALNLAKNYTDSAIIILNKVGILNEVSGAYKQLSTIQQLLGDYKGAYYSQVLFKQMNDSVFNIEKDKKITQTSMQYEFDKKEASVKSEQEKKDIQQRNIRNSISGALAGSLIFLVVVYRQRNKISKARKRSDELLLNILPEEVAEELKAKGSAAAKQFDEVTVMFTDFKDFTRISEKLSPKELVAEIDACFKAFDNIITKHNIEKIKTVGDSYMCAGGLPVANKTNATDVVKAALEIQHFMLKHFQQRKSENKELFEIRTGIHTGPVVAGIVGVKKFAYDIWGDTVNIASRMESSGEAGKINISGNTYELVKAKFTCTHRGKIQAKNKGEIDMYFVERVS